MEDIFTKLFNSDDGKIVLSHLETCVLTRLPFSSDDPATDALLRQGAITLLNEIYNNINEK